MEKWEYLIATSLSGDMMNVTELNKYGEEGWELISVVKVGNIFRQVFKRPKDRPEIELL